MEISSLQYSFTIYSYVFPFDSTIFNANTILPKIPYKPKKKNKGYALPSGIIPTIIGGTLTTTAVAIQPSVLA